MNRKILAVDDDLHILQMVQHYLEEENHRVYTAENGGQALQILKNHPIDIVLLDMVLPDYDGLDLLAEIRKISDAAVIIVSGKGEAADRIVGLEMGADDYVTKPFHLRELSARIKSVLRRAPDGTEHAEKQGQGQHAGGADEQHVIEFDGWKMDCDRYELHSPEGKLVPLTTGEFNLLRVMTGSTNRALSRDYLFDVTRDGEYESFDRALDIQVNRLRRKLGDDPRSPRLIKTVRGVGYMFIGGVGKPS